MILTQYATSKKYKDTEYSMSITALQKQNKIIPKPKYFVTVSNGADHVDTDHSSFKIYLKHLKDKKKYKPNAPNNDLLKIINATIKVVTERYDEDEARAVSELIMLELKSGK